MPKVVDHEKVRIDLVEAAARVIARVGPDQASIRLIAAECGRSPAAPLHYFGTRENLFEFAFKHFSDRSIAELNRIIARPGDMPERMGRVVECLLDRSAGDIFFARSLIAMVMGSSDNAAIKRIDVETYTETTRLVQEAFVTAQLAGVVPRGLDPEAEAALLISIADGLLVAAITMGDEALRVKERLKPTLLKRWGIEGASGPTPRAQKSSRS
jgi:AcrR family transcriptional regulator